MAFVSHAQMDIIKCDSIYWNGKVLVQQENSQEKDLRLEFERFVVVVWRGD